MSVHVVLDDAAAIEQLVRRFYATRDPAERSLLDTQLTDLQSRPQAFGIADQLLNSRFPEVRLYGANTFIAKIKSDLRILDDDQQGEVQIRLLSWLRSSMEEAFSQPVMAKKVCSAVVECFIASEGSWLECVPSVLDLFIHHAGQVTETLEKDFVNNMAETDKLGVLWFISTLVDMIGARESDLASTDALRRLIDRDLPRAVHLVCSIFIWTVSQEPANYESHAGVSHDAILCLSSLMMWTRDSSGCAEAIDELRDIMQWLIHNIPKSEFFEIASSTTYEIIIDYPQFLQETHWEAIAAVLLSDWPLSLLQAAAFDESDSVAVAKILLAYAEARWAILCSATNTESDRRILESCLLTLKGSGIPNVDDEIAYIAVDLWTMLIEEMQFAEDPMWLEIKNSVIPEALRSTRVRVMLPSADKLSTFTQYETSCFGSFRSCAGDFIEAIARFLDVVQVSSFFTSNIRQGLPLQLWPDVETDLFCLNSIISKGGYQSLKDVSPIICPLLTLEDGSPSFINALLEYDTNVPPKVCKAAASLFVNIGELLKDDQQSLSSALGCLFKWIQAQNPELNVRLASAISKLCSEARDALTGSGPWLCSELELYASSAQHRDSAVYEKLFGAVAAIAQASTVKAWNGALSMIKRLLDLIQRDADGCLELYNSNPVSAKEFGLTALRCLANMGTAFRSPDADVIDLDDEDGSKTTNPWATEQHVTIEIQQKIMSLCSAVFERVHDAEELNAICVVLKAGYTEDGPGPFVFPLSETLGLLQRTSLSHPGIGEVLSNCLTLLRRNRKRKTQDIAQFAVQCAKHISSQLPNVFIHGPSADPEAATLIVDFFRSYIPEYASELTADEVIRIPVFHFIVSCLQCHEILPKTSAAQFWSSYLSTPSAERDAVEQEIVMSFGRDATVIIAEQICGQASRSELECLSIALRAIVARGAPLRDYLRQAMSAAQCDSPYATEQNKRIFVEMVLNLRGSARTRKVVEEFWAQSQGTFVPAD